MKKLLVLMTLTVALVLCLSACGEKNAHTHQYGEWMITKTATCTEDGTQTRYCSCGEKQIDVFYATGHKEEILPAKESTCVSTGLTEGKLCSTCGAVIVSQEEIPLKGHTEKILPAVKSTCTQKGLSEGKECSVCQTILVSQEPLPLKDHIEIIDAGIAATCIQTGLTEGKHCSACNTVIVARQEIPVVSHTYDDKYDESCNECGFIRDAECNHKNTEVIAGKDATCTEIGYTNGSKCTKCGEIVIVQEVIEATGHGENLKKIEAKDPTFDTTGNYEYWKCSKCEKCYNDEKTTNEIVEASTVIPVIPSYTITFVDRENQQDKTERYSQNQSLFVSGTPTEIEGYNFVGWYTAEGKHVEYIAKGNAENYILYAKREAIRYSITYVDAPINSNVVTYTVEDEVQLIAPEWIGLSFKNWTDSNNEVVTKISKGSIGNITLRANWLSEENLATSTDDNEPEGVIFDETLNKYYFIYEMGVIDNIVLGIVESQDKSTMESLTFSKSNTISIENSIADTVAETISKSISKTNGWSESRNLALSYSQTIDRSISAGLEVEEVGVKGKLEASLSISDTFETGVALDYGKHSSETIDSTSEQSVSSTVAYAKGQSTTITASSTIDGAMPKGTYRYVVVAKVTVYAIVTYDIITGDYYLDTYSVMDDDIRDKRLYQAPSDTTANITTNDALSFDIKDKDFKNYIDSSYYVKYDANGGKGEEMLLSVFSIDESYALTPNQYFRDGYTFSGWSRVKNDSANVYTDQELVSNLGNGGELVVIYAIWSLNEYEVTWDTIPNCTITVTRKSSRCPNAYIGELRSGDTIYAYDELEVTYKADTGYHFEANGVSTSVTKHIAVTKNFNANDIAVKPIVNTYTVVYDGNGSLGGSMGSVVHTYGTSVNLTKNSFSRHGWTFIGWKDQNGKTYTDGQQVNNLTSKHGDTIILYAQWEIITVAIYNKDYIDVPSTGTYGGSGDISNLLDVATLINHGYKYRITIHYDLTVHGDHLYAITSLKTNQEIFNSGKVYYDHNATASPTYTTTGNASDFRNNTYFEILFDAKGMSIFDVLNHFSVSNLKITIEFYK